MCFDDYLVQIIDLTKKMEHQRDTVVDAIFKKALREFHTELLSYHPTMKVTLIVLQRVADVFIALGFVIKEDQVAIKYKDLIQTFEWTLNRVCVQEQTSSTTFPVILGVNAFRGFLNEFVQTRKKVESKTRTRVSDVVLSDILLWSFLTFFICFSPFEESERSRMSL